MRFYILAVVLGFVACGPSANGDDNGEPIQSGRGGSGSGQGVSGGGTVGEGENVGGQDGENPDKPAPVEKQPEPEVSDGGTPEVGEDPPVGLCEDSDIPTVREACRADVANFADNEAWQIKNFCDCAVSPLLKYCKPVRATWDPCTGIDVLEDCARANQIIAGCS